MIFSTTCSMLATSFASRRHAHRQLAHRRFPTQQCVPAALDAVTDNREIFEPAIVEAVCSTRVTNLIAAGLFATHQGLIRAADCCVEVFSGMGCRDA